MRSLAEWALALGVLAGAVWMAAPVVQRLAPRGSSSVTLVESPLPDLPGNVPDDAESVPLLMLLDGSVVRVGMTEKTLATGSLPRWASGPGTIERGIIGDRLVRPFRCKNTRFWVVLDRMEAGHERQVTAIYVR
jgi:hypothetical protein